MEDEMVQQVSKRTGLSPEASRQAVDAVVGVLKQKLPAPIANHIDSVLAGGGADLGKLATELAGMFGGTVKR